MFLGHYGVALAARPAMQETSLGTAAFATQWLDELWPILLLAGIESVRIVPGLMAASPLDFVHYPWSHSLLAALVWAALIGGMYFAVRRRGRAAWIIAALVASHWFLDAPMHRPDLPLWPGSETHVGFGLWNSLQATLVLELLLFGGGLFLYLRATRARDRIGSWGLYGMVAIMLLIFLGGAAGSPPPDQRALAFFTLGLWLFVPWSAWVDRHRVSRSRTASAPD